MRLTFFICYAIILSSSEVFSQENIESDSAATIKIRKPVSDTIWYGEIDYLGNHTIDTAYSWVEQMPEFPGGEAALARYLAKVPHHGTDIDIEGTVFVSIIIDKIGKVAMVNVVSGVHKIVDDIAKEHISKMPDWIPGRQNGIPVNVKLVLPVRVMLE